MQCKYWDMSAGWFVLDFPYCRLFVFRTVNEPFRWLWFSDVFWTGAIEIWMWFVRTSYRLADLYNSVLQHRRRSCKSLQRGSRCVYYNWETETETDRQTDRDRDTETQKETHRDIGDKDTDTHRDRDTETDWDRDKQTDPLSVCLCSSSLHLERQSLHYYY